jgi:hypothetical protein
VIDWIEVEEIKLVYDIYLIILLGTSKAPFLLRKCNQPYLLSSCSGPCEVEELSFSEDSDS